jgi:hypothetical protein
VEKQPELLAALQELVVSAIRGDRRSTMPFMAKVTGVNPSPGLDSNSYVVSVEIRSPALSASEHRP